jgi:hypothetical protein
VELLGFYVDAFGLTATESRIQGFKDIVFPSTLKALEAYLGACGYLRTMVPYFAQLAEPLQRRKVALLAEGRNSGKIKTPGTPPRLHVAAPLSQLWKRKPRLKPYRRTSASACGLHIRTPRKCCFYKSMAALNVASESSLST